MEAVDARAAKTLAILQRHSPCGPFPEDEPPTRAHTFRLSELPRNVGEARKAIAAAIREFRAAVELKCERLANGDYLCPQVSDYVCDRWERVHATGAFVALLNPPNDDTSAWTTRETPSGGRVAALLPGELNDLHDITLTLELLRPLRVHLPNGPLLVSWSVLAHLDRIAEHLDPSPRKSVACVADDYSWLQTAEGVVYHFSAGLQRQVIEILWQDWKAGGQGLGLSAIAARVDQGRKSIRIDHVFLNHPTLRTIIVSERRGIWRLRV